MKRATLGLLIAATAAAAGLSADAGRAASPGPLDAGAAEVPQGVRIEHQELLAELAAAAREPGELGRAARAVEAPLRPHFANEEDSALPPLGLLPGLAEGRGVTPETAAAVVAMAERPRADQARLFDEHAAIVAAAGELGEIAGRHGAPAYERLAERLALHAADEVEVLHPASILVGEYLKAQLSHQ